MRFPPRVEAGQRLSLPTSGSGDAVLLVVGPGQIVRRQVRLGEKIVFAPGDLHSAGHYVAWLVGPNATERAQFNVVSKPEPASLSFLAKPSRVPVSQRDGISGVAYVFDIYGNLILEPVPVSFELLGVPGATQKTTVPTRNGVAWVRMNSAPRAGAAQYQARAGNVVEKRVIQQVAGDPCSLRMHAQPASHGILVETEPVRDCSGNAVPDGTVVTFTEVYAGGQATVDVPLKRDVARAEIPARDGALISVAAGVVMGNEIRWSGR
jgi:hypothetical protein